MQIKQKIGTLQSDKIST